MASEPGWTKETQTIQVMRGIKILDSPGVVFESKGSESQNVLLRNVIKVDDMSDPVAVGKCSDQHVHIRSLEVYTASLIYDRIMPLNMSRIYAVPEPDPKQEAKAVDFLVKLALSSGRLLKTGVPDIESMARSIIRDWNTHKIPFFSEPPNVHASSLPGSGAGATDIGDAMVVSGGFSQAFELEGLWDRHDNLDSTEKMDEDWYALIP